jgi:hypothetical protein
MKAFGRGAYQRTRVNSSGAPTGLLTRKKKAFGFQTGTLCWRSSRAVNNEERISGG